MKVERGNVDRLLVLGALSNFDLEIKLLISRSVTGAAYIIAVFEVLAAARFAVAENDLP